LVCRKAATLLVCLSLLLALICKNARVEAQTYEVETFFNSKIPGMRIQVNATSIARPTEEISVNFSITSDIQGIIEIASMNLTIYGFRNGTDKTKIYTNSWVNFNLSGTKVYGVSFYIPERIWGVTYGEIILNYNITVKDEFGTHEYQFRNLILGFTMTPVENVYLESLEEQLTNLRNILKELNQTFTECFGRNLTRNELLNLNQTLWELRREYETLEGVKSELVNARTAMVFLAVVAVFFVATTAYLVFRKPREYL